MQEKQKKPIYKKWWFWLILVVVLVGIGGASQTGGGEEQSLSGTVSQPSETQLSENQPPEATPTPRPETYEIIGDVTFEDDGFACYLTGTLKNNSGKECSYIQISFNLYDEDGNQIGTALDNLNNLADGGTWKFKAMGIDTTGDVASWELADISAF